MTLVSLQDELGYFVKNKKEMHEFTGRWQFTKINTIWNILKMWYIWGILVFVTLLKDVLVGNIQPKKNVLKRFWRNKTFLSMTSFRNIATSMASDGITTASTLQR